MLEYEILSGPVPAGSLILYYPPGYRTFPEDGSVVQNRDIAKEILEAIRRGEDVAIPLDVDKHGKRQWVLKHWDGEKVIEV